ncbi:MAG: SHOCT domain-containing protein [Planctomycetaceae bacterium]|nr:SHOCT domain-containing protein [Planctomycetaceae bacterium]
MASNELFESGEVLLAAITGQVREASDKSHGGFSLANASNLKGGMFSKHYLLFTDRRVILWGRGTLRSTNDSFDFDAIRSVEIQVGILLASIVFNVGRTENFANVQKADAKHVVTLIREQLAKRRKTPTSPPHNSADQQKDDPIDQIRRLAELRDSGAISDEEFVTLKQKLIGRL